MLDRMKRGGQPGQISPDLLRCGSAEPGQRSEKRNLEIGRMEILSSKDGNLKLDEPADRQSNLRFPLLELKISNSSVFKFPQRSSLSGKDVVALSHEFGG